MQSRQYQVALVDEPRGTVLAVPGEDGALRLPTHPSRWPGHRDLVAAGGGGHAYLEVPPYREDDGTVTNLLFSDGTTSLPDAVWVPVADLPVAGMSPAAADLLRGHLAERAALRDGAPVPDDGRSAWYLPGWRAEVEAWVDDVARDRGFTRRGAPVAEKIWMLSAVLRFPVLRDGVETDVWFKATCEGFRAEPALTRVISEVEPDLVPALVAVDEERAWLLMDPIDADEDHPRADGGPAAARALARLQLETLGHRDRFLAAGTPDRGLAHTLAGLHTCVHESVERDDMGEDLRRDAVASEEWLADQLRELWSTGLPDTFSHGDLHLGNVAWDGDRPVFYDWTDACLTHPFLDARHLADSAAEEVAEDGKEAARAEVWEAYAEPWRAAYPDLDLDAVWQRARLAEAVFTMVSYEQIYRAQRPDSRWELSGVVVQILQRLCELRREAAG